MKYIILLILIFSNTASVFAAPAITGINDDTISHGQSITISDSANGFGAKSPAAPLMWDNGEDSTANSPAAVLTKGWEDVRPDDGEADDSTYDMQYRTTWMSIPQAHTKSTQYLAAGYYPECRSTTQPCNNVQLSISSTDGDGGHVYAMWYLRADPSWEDVPHDTNYKESFLRRDDASSWDDTDGAYFAVATDDSPFAGLDTILLSLNRNNFADKDFDDIPNPAKSWVHREIYARQNPAYVAFITDNVHATGSPKSQAGDLNSDNSIATLGGMTIGGYARAYLSGGTTDARMRLWFDDIYIDTTWARVMLANHQTYASATIVEPQIPSAWAVGEITVTVNQGALPNGTAYLFVFDSDNVANNTGYPITLSDQYPPTISGCVFK